MNPSIAKTLLAASIAALAMTANAQYAAPPATGNKVLSDSDIRTYKDGRRACSKLPGAQKEDCQKKLAAKYVDKQCQGLSGDKLDKCLEGEYPGE
jgi:hypothetical protein